MTIEDPKVLPTLRRRGDALADPAVQLERLEDVAVADPRGGDFDRHLEEAGLFPLRATGIDVLQVNVGRVCNQTCAHCHVDAGPDRTESMSEETAEECLRALAATDIPTLDVTGGAPELSPVFRRLVTGARELGRHVMDRCNLTVLLAPRYEDLPEFLAEKRVEVVASLPHYRRVSTDRQRGDGVFERSIEGLRRLNAVGYGREGSGLRSGAGHQPGRRLPAPRPGVAGGRVEARDEAAPRRRLRRALHDHEHAHQPLLGVADRGLRQPGRRTCSSWCESFNPARRRRA